MNITTFGIDIAKTVFHIIGLNQANKIVVKRKLKRHQLLAYFANQMPCKLSMEACASSHYWGRQIERLGFEVKLIPAQHVKAFVRGNKNDYNDALAIAEAFDRPGMHSVAIKTVQQQDVQALHRMRSATVAERTALCNQIRGLLGEYGIIVNLGVYSLRKTIPQLLEDAVNGLTDLFRELLAQKYQQLQELDEHVTYYTNKLKQQAMQSETTLRLQSIPGFGPIVASSYHSVIGDGKAFKKGRDVSASLGLVPRQHSTGGKDTLLGISKRGVTVQTKTYFQHDK
jgi:transposase